MGSCASIYKRNMFRFRKKVKEDAPESDDEQNPVIQRQYTDTTKILKKKSLSKSEPDSLKKRSYAVNIGSTDPVDEFGLEYNSDDPELTFDTTHHIDNLSDIDPLDNSVHISYNSKTIEQDTLDKELAEFIHV